jgi:hypothetical protein
VSKSTSKKRNSKTAKKSSSKISKKDVIEDFDELDDDNYYVSKDTKIATRMETRKIDNSHLFKKQKYG